MSRIKLTAILLMALFTACCATSQKNDVFKNSVEVTNMAANSGGSGTVLLSSKSDSYVLTNSHVCNLVKNGGLVTGDQGQYLVNAYKESKLHDLCVIRVSGNLGYNTNIANKAPRLYYDSASIAGHPHLMPEVVTKGHFSGRSIIQVLIGTKKCTADDLNDPNKVALCMILGGLPLIKSYDSVLVTATIMPGSSGSGVYNSKGELAGVVFAGQGDFGYAWTVPYDAMYNFLFREIGTIKWQIPDNLVDIVNDGKNNSSYEDKLKSVCSSQNKYKFKEVCDLFNSEYLK